MDVTASHLTIFDDTDRHRTDAPKTRSGRTSAASSRKS